MEGAIEKNAVTLGRLKVKLNKLLQCLEESIGIGSGNLFNELDAGLEIETEVDEGPLDALALVPLPARGRTCGG